MIGGSGLERVVSAEADIDEDEPTRRAWDDFKRMMKWIIVAGIAMTVGALWYLSLYDALSLHMVVATIAGVFFSVLLGCGLFAAAFFSDKSGHDRGVSESTRRKPPPSRTDETP